MGFVIQWLACLVAFVGGSGLAYGIALLLKPKHEETRPEIEVAAEPEVQPVQPESSEIGAQL